MVFTIITHVAHEKRDGKYFAYMPYVREMNLWIEHVDQVTLVGPISPKNVSSNRIPYDHENICFCGLKEFDMVTVRGSLRALIAIPFNAIKIFGAMLKSDHIHLRCPSNVGVLAVVIQILFPFKNKTAKFAGNWGESYAQPWSYRFQKWVLRNTLLTHSMKVLVYGEWPSQTRNVVPFFTASYSRNEIVPLQHRVLNGIVKLVFVGTLTSNKNPLLSIRVAETLSRMGVDVQLDLLGDGVEKEDLVKYVQEKQLNNFVFIRGNVPGEEVKRVMANAHFLVFFSNSEGWPKAVAESMFWGCVPVTRSVSCVHWMLDGGNRGVLVDTRNPDILASEILSVLNNPSRFHNMSAAGAAWSRQYTLEGFQNAIRTLV